MSQKCSSLFYCELCDYKCSKQSVFNKHLSTAKHQKITNGNNNVPLTCKQCFQTFKYRSGLSRHSKKCGMVAPKQLESNTKTDNIDISKSDIFMILQQNHELLTSNQEFKQLMMDQSRQIQETQQKNEELQKQLIEAVKVGGSHIENQTNIHNNQKFNLQFFLNEQCKDAINMSDFIENMELDLEDLTETGRLGYVGGISRILINKLQELDIYKRPLHCTDMKRETLYIKDNDEWEKQTNSKEKMSKIIGQVANKNCRNLPKWTEEHPEYQVFDSPDNMEYMNMTQAVLGGFGEEENKQFKDKIIRGVIKEVLVNK
jgi:hypothetical protein